MRVALLISGYLRGYDKNIEFIKREIFDKFEKVDTYLHITKNENIEDKYFNNIDDLDIKNFIEILSPIVTIIEDNDHNYGDKNKNSLFNNWKKIFKLNTIKKINEKSNNFTYDLVIRYRPDLNILDNNIFNDFETDVIYLPSDSKIDKRKLKNTDDKYICDVFAFGNSKIMDVYLNLFENINDLTDDGCYVSETILNKHLNNNNIKVKPININFEINLSKCNVFAICGDSGSGKSTLSKLLKNSFSDSFMLECDRYHKWERTNEKWGEITHLNPNANYISKMDEDVFNLKIGNTIFQVDYDHHTGKFTEPEEINPSNNLIVCGLHSLYNKTSVYDLKIFMDTDDLLKKKWKIKRDVKERGYSIDKVLDNIKKRENDFREFIIPQKNNADIIINFHPKGEINLCDLDTNDDVSLKVLINENLKIKHITNFFEEKKIFFTLKKNDGFYVISFTDYKKIDDITINNDFYDYIIFMILNL